MDPDFRARLAPDVLAHLDAAAREQYGRPLADLGPDEGLALAEAEAARLAAAVFNDLDADAGTDDWPTGTEAGP